jgi:hypothetical protein
LYRGGKASRLLRNAGAPHIIILPILAFMFGCLLLQFNFVVSTNPAVTLWQQLGFKIVGTLPHAFNNLSLGRRVDAYVMYRLL